MQFLILIVFFLFAGVELFQWLKGVMLPLPVYVFAGAFLAIASNYEKGLGLLSGQAFSPYEKSRREPVAVIEIEPLGIPAGEDRTELLGEAASWEIGNGKEEHS